MILINSDSLIGKKIKKWQRPLIHTFIWLVIVFINIHLLSNFFPVNDAIVRAVFIFGFLAFFYYFNTLVIIPFFFSRKKYIFYILTLICILIGVSVLNKILSQHFGLPKIPIDRLHHPPPPGSRFMAVSVFMVFVIGAALKLIGNYKEIERQKKDILAEKNKAELKLLKAQVNPHFLFNTLNNIYALSIGNSKQVPEMIMSLSEIMRYMLHDAKPLFVDIEKEISYLKSYIQLEKLRCENTERIESVFEVESNSFKLAPLLFIPFVENAFKHSRIVDSQGAWIKIKLMQNNGKVSFICENSIPAKQFQKDQTGGIGLENIKKRLKLIYPDKHELNIKTEKDIFSVSLELY